MSIVKRNIIANFFGALFRFIAAYAFIPIYLKLLGPEQYGVIAFYAVLHGAFAFADMGLSAALKRETARMSGNSDYRAKLRDLIRTSEIIYGLLALSVIVVVYFSAHFISTKWINVEQLPLTSLERSVQLMGVIIGLQLIVTQYQGCLLGLQRQLEYNFLVVSFSFLQGIGACLILWKISSSTEAFFLWQSIVTVVMLIMYRKITWRYISNDMATTPRFQFSTIRDIWPYAAGMLGSSVLSITLTQADKVIVSRAVSLEYFGYYVLAGTLAQIPNILVMPIHTALFPRFVQLITLGDIKKLRELYHIVSQAMSLLILTTTMVMACFSEEIISVWTNNAHVAGIVTGAASILVIGTGILAIQIMPYTLQLAFGYTRIILIVGVISTMIMVPMLILFTNHYGITGAATGWVILNAASLLIVSPIVHTRFLTGDAIRWLFKDVFFPAITVLPVVIAARWLLDASMAPLVVVIWAGVVFLFSIALGVTVQPELRKIVIGYLRRLKIY